MGEDTRITHWTVEDPLPYSYDCTTESNYVSNFLTVLFGSSKRLSVSLLTTNLVPFVENFLMTMEYKYHRNLSKCKLLPDKRKK